MECVDEGWIKFDTEQDENRFIHLVRDIAPSAQPRWISVTENLPSKPGRYLVTVSRMIGDYVKSEFFDGDDFWDGEVRAWCPLPAPYRPEE